MRTWFIRCPEWRQFLSDDLTKANVTSKPIKDAISFFVSLEHDGVTPGECITLADQQVYQNMFAQGLVGSFMGGHWAVDYLESRDPVPPYGVTLLKNKQVGSSTGGWILAMSRHSLSLGYTIHGCIRLKT